MQNVKAEFQPSVFLGWHGSPKAYKGTSRVAESSFESSTKCEDERVNPRMPKLPANRAPSVGAKVRR